MQLVWSDMYVLRVAKVGDEDVSLLSHTWNTAATIFAVEPLFSGVSIYDIVNGTFVVLFTLEMLLKVVARGLREYLRSGWNALDALAVVTGLLSLRGAFDGGISGGALALRLLRLLRPLRLVQRSGTLRLLFGALMEALSSTGRAFLLLGICTGIFAIVGVASFHNSLRHGCHRLGADGSSWEATGDVCNAQCEVDTLSQQLVGHCASFGNRTKGLASQSWGYSCLPDEQCLCSAANASEYCPSTAWQRA